MQEIKAPSSSPLTAKRAPLHDEIAQCARELWVKYGQPADRDTEIWLEAEQRLNRTAAVVREKASAPVASLTRSEPAAVAARPANQEGARAVVAPPTKSAIKVVSGNRKPSR
jgi:hypothetical protein